MKYFEVNEGIISFNIRTFLETQERIYNKWPLNVEPIQNINNYFLHIMEEVYEVDDSNGAIDEMVDVLMYIGSSVNCFKDLDGELILDKLTSIDIDVSKEERVTSLHEVVFDLLALRRIYPERKWHKPMPEISIDERFERRLKTTQYYYHIIKKTLSIMIYKFNLEEIDEEIKRKQSFIMSLKDGSNN